MNIFNTVYIILIWRNIIHFVEAGIFYSIIMYGIMVPKNYTYALFEKMQPNFLPPIQAQLLLSLCYTYFDLRKRTHMYELPIASDTTLEKHQRLLDAHSRSNEIFF